MSPFRLARALVWRAALLTMLWPSGASAQGPIVVRPGDRITVRFTEANTIHQVLVDERGRVDLPMIGLLPVGATSPQAFQDSVSALYGRFFQPGGVTVRFERRISILGDVRRPDLYHIDLSVRLRDAIGIAGGVTEISRANEVTLIRDGALTRVRDWRNGEAGNLELRSGDQLVVPREPWFVRNAIPFLSVISVLGSFLITVLAN